MTSTMTSVCGLCVQVYRRHGDARTDRTVFRAAAVVRAIAVHNINVKNKLTGVQAKFSESKPRQIGTYMIYFGATTRRSR